MTRSGFLILGGSLFAEHRVRRRPCLPSSTLRGVHFKALAAELETRGARADVRERIAEFKEREAELREILIAATRSEARRRRVDCARFGAAQENA